MKKRSTKEIKLQAKKSLQGHVGTVILGLLAVYRSEEHTSELQSLQ